MTVTMMRYTKRLATLRAQIDFVVGITRQIDAFPGEQMGK